MVCLDLLQDVRLLASFCDKNKGISRDQIIPNYSSIEEWSCDLEEKAIAALNSTVCPTECPTEPPNAPNGTTGFFDWYVVLSVFLLGWAISWCGSLWVSKQALFINNISHNE
ncbi:hypothetical protein Y032_0030g2174 [Ancylostoma ceylanicum]|uniref:Uncharacterized protein n=1 Tax=Ancylostoma ceylanicum TaxID=53326 RepID=A0A016URS2_9BILA|nr:hypothetical protein Y032_0030g2174 [Ancylostoma ceylanicum]